MFKPTLFCTLLHVIVFFDFVYSNNGGILPLDWVKIDPNQTDFNNSTKRAIVNSGVYKDLDSDSTKVEMLEYARSNTMNGGILVVCKITDVANNTTLLYGAVTESMIDASQKKVTFNSVGGGTRVENLFEEALIQVKYAAEEYSRSTYAFQPIWETLKHLKENYMNIENALLFKSDTLAKYNLKFQRFWNAAPEKTVVLLFTNEDKSVGVFATVKVNPRDKPATIIRYKVIKDSFIKTFEAFWKYLETTVDIEYNWNLTIGGTDPFSRELTSKLHTAVSWLNKNTALTMYARTEEKNGIISIILQTSERAIRNSMFVVLDVAEKRLLHASLLGSLEDTLSRYRSFSRSEVWGKDNTDIGALNWSDPNKENFNHKIELAILVTQMLKIQKFEVLEFATSPTGKGHILVLCNITDSNNQVTFLYAALTQSFESSEMKVELNSIGKILPTTEPSYDTLITVKYAAEQYRRTKYAFKPVWEVDTRLNDAYPKLEKMLDSKLKKDLDKYKLKFLRFWDAVPGKNIVVLFISGDKHSGAYAIVKISPTDQSAHISRFKVIKESFVNTLEALWKYLDTSVDIEPNWRLTKGAAEPLPTELASALRTSAPWLHESTVPTIYAQSEEKTGVVSTIIQISGSDKQNSMFAVWNIMGKRLVHVSLLGTLKETLVECCSFSAAQIWTKHSNEDGVETTGSDPNSKNDSIKTAIVNSGVFKNLDPNKIEMLQSELSTAENNHVVFCKITDSRSKVTLLYAALTESIEDSNKKIILNSVGGILHVQQPSYDDLIALKYAAGLYRRSSYAFQPVWQTFERLKEKYQNLGDSLLAELAKKLEEYNLQFQSFWDTIPGKGIVLVFANMEKSVGAYVTVKINPTNQTPQTVLFNLIKGEFLNTFDVLWKDLHAMFDFEWKLVKGEAKPMSRQMVSTLHGSLPWLHMDIVLTEYARMEKDGILSTIFQTSVSSKSNSLFAIWDVAKKRLVHASFLGTLEQTLSKYDSLRSSEFWGKEYNAYEGGVSWLSEAAALKVFNLNVVRDSILARDPSLEEKGGNMLYYGLLANTEDYRSNKKVCVIVGNIDYSNFVIVVLNVHDKTHMEAISHKYVTFNAPVLKAPRSIVYDMIDIKPQYSSDTIVWIPGSPENFELPIKNPILSHLHNTSKEILFYSENPTTLLVIIKFIDVKKMPVSSFIALKKNGEAYDVTWVGEKNRLDKLRMTVQKTLFEAEAYHFTSMFAYKGPQLPYNKELFFWNVPNTNGKISIWGHVEEDKVLWYTYKISVPATGYSGERTYNGTSHSTLHEAMEELESDGLPRMYSMTPNIPTSGAITWFKTS